MRSFYVNSFRAQGGGGGGGTSAASLRYNNLGASISFVNLQTTSMPSRLANQSNTIAVNFF